MKKNIFVLVAFGLILGSFYRVEAQQPAKVRKIGFLIQSGGTSGSLRFY